MQPLSHEGDHANQAQPADARILAAGPPSPSPSPASAPWRAARTRTLAERRHRGKQDWLSLAQRAARAGRKRRRRTHMVLRTFRDRTTVRARQRGTEGESGPRPRIGKLSSEEGTSSVTRTEMFDFVQPHSLAPPTAQSREPERVRKHSSTCPICRTPATR